MNEFVNYKKRNINLPWGCKDLQAVLQPQQVKESVSDATITHEKSFVAALSEIGKYVGMMFESRALLFMWEIDAPDKGLKLNVTQMEGGTMFASVDFREDSGPEAAMRGFFARAGLKVPYVSGMSENFSPCSPGWLSYRIVPLPTDARALADLLTSLFRDVCGLKGEDGLRFQIYEFSQAG